MADGFIWSLVEPHSDRPSWWANCFEQFAARANGPRSMHFCHSLRGFRWLSCLTGGAQPDELSGVPMNVRVVNGIDPMVAYTVGL